MNLTAFNFTTIDGSSLPGLVSCVTCSRPTKLVVFCHGHHEPMTVFSDHMSHITNADTAAIALTYRDDEKFPVLKGAIDAIYATNFILGPDSPLIPNDISQIFIYGASMGGMIASTAVYETLNQPLINGRKFNYLVDVAGPSNLLDLYVQSAIFYQEAKTEIEYETGGNPVLMPREYERRSPTLNAQKIKQTGITAVEIVHANYDGLILYSHATEFKAALDLAGVSANLSSLTCTSTKTELGTRIFDQPTAILGDLLGGVFAGLTESLALVLSGCSPFGNKKMAGHVMTYSTINPAMKKGLERLNYLLQQA